ncbi:intraflagellar transport protein 140 homolog [Hydra vulgaris]|uniref:Intraflagellar transport protein 140 homolog n=1 Tax=Hydra vulgaris TaxID=6087 RepID=A0ABM4CB27_HYDVU
MKVLTTTTKINLTIFEYISVFIGTLAGGTDQGHVALWKYNSLKNDDQLWVLQPPSDVVGSVTHLEWGASLGLIAVNCVSSVTILNKATMSYCFSGNIAAVQLSPAHLLIKFYLCMWKI